MRSSIRRTTSSWSRFKNVPELVLTLQQKEHPTLLHAVHGDRTTRTASERAISCHPPAIYAFTRVVVYHRRLHHAGLPQIDQMFALLRSHEIVIHKSARVPRYGLHPDLPDENNKQGDGVRHHWLDANSVKAQSAHLIIHRPATWIAAHQRCMVTAYRVPLKHKLALAHTHPLQHCDACLLCAALVPLTASVSSHPSCRAFWAAWLLERCAHDIQVHRVPKRTLPDP